MKARRFIHSPDPSAFDASCRHRRVLAEHRANLLPAVDPAQMPMHELRVSSNIRLIASVPRSVRQPQPDHASTSGPSAPRQVGDASVILSPAKEIA
jgi:hypothetical protein